MIRRCERGKVNKGSLITVLMVLALFPCAQWTPAVASFPISFSIKYAQSIATFTHLRDESSSYIMQRL